MQEHFSILVILFRPLSYRLRNLLYQAKQILKVYDERINKNSRAQEGGREEGEFRLSFFGFSSYHFLRILLYIQRRSLSKFTQKKGYVKTVEPSGAISFAFPLHHTRRGGIFLPTIQSSNTFLMIA